MLISDCRTAVAAALSRVRSKTASPQPRRRCRCRCRCRRAAARMGARASGVQPAEVHALASDGADLVGGIADQYGPAGHHAAGQPGADAEAAEHAVARRVHGDSGSFADAAAPARRRRRRLRRPASSRTTQRRIPPGSGKDSTIPPAARNRAASGPKPVLVGEVAHQIAVRVVLRPHRGALQRPHGGPHAVGRHRRAAPNTGPGRRPGAASTVTRPPSSCSPVTRTRGAGHRGSSSRTRRSRTASVRACGSGQDEGEALRHPGEGHLGELLGRRPRRCPGGWGPPRPPVRGPRRCVAGRPAPGDGCRWPASAGPRAVRCSRIRTRDAALQQQGGQKSPTGPPPTIRTSAHGTRTSRPVLLRRGSAGSGTGSGGPRSTPGEPAAGSSATV